MEFILDVSPICMSQIHLSVVVPLYNKRPTLLSSLQSIANQSYRDFECVVVDDGSTDGSSEVAQSFGDPRFRVVRQTNQGVSAARNRGVREATGDLIAFLDADDLWEPDFLQAIVDLRQRYPAAGLYVTGVGRCFADGRDDHLLSASAPDDDHAVLVDDYLQASQEGSFVTASSVAIPKQVLLDSGGFPEGVTVGEDVDTWVRIGLNHPVACDSRILAYYFTPPARQQAMLAKSRARPLTELPVALRNLMMRMSKGDIPPHRRQAVASYLDFSLLAHTDYLLYHGNARELRFFLDQTKATDPAVRARLSRIRSLASFLPPRLVLALLHRTALLRNWAQGRSRDLSKSSPRYLTEQLSVCRHLSRLP